MRLSENVEPAAFEALHRYVLLSFLWTDANARRPTLVTTLPDVVVHSYTAGGFEVTEQSAKYDVVSINVALYGVLNAGLSISE